MKNDAIRKINTIGTVGYVLSTIAKVFLIIGIAGTLAATVFFAVIPADAFSVSIGGEMKTTVDLSKYITIGDKDAESVVNGINSDSEINVTGMDYTVESIEIKDSVIYATAKADEAMTITPRTLVGPMISSLLYLAASLVSVWFFCLLCGAFKNCTSPFEENVIKKMKNFAFSLIPWAVIASLSESVSKSFYTGNVDITIGVNIGMVIVILIVFALAFIFNYGAKLQKEADETL